jgi:hypothetical protein
MTDDCVLPLCRSRESAFHPVFIQRIRFRLVAVSVIIPPVFRRGQSKANTTVTLLLARHSPVVEPLVEKYVELGDKKELKKIVSECEERAAKLRRRTNLSD